MTKVLGVIPARLESQRLPRKVLRAICGRPMIAWVYERARPARCLDRLLVATDSEEVASFCRGSNIPVTMTSKDHRSGTERIVEVMAREPADIFVNIQGDEPTITPEHLDLLLRPFQSNPGTEVSTLKVSIPIEEARDPDNVKVVTDASGRALYFSRALIPYQRKQDAGASGQTRYYKHLGIYAYSAPALRKFSSLAVSPLEELEKLEQLRFLENGIPISVVETEQDAIGVDSEADLRKVEEFFRRAGQDKD
jgi:3-deoxy-manno-octulosonate cytidylyltransferase (CMP-KDO synthetase)